MADEGSDALEVRLTPEDQMVLKYLVKLVLQGVSRDEIALAFDHAFTGVRDVEVAALRALVQGRNALPELDRCLQGGRFETLRLAVHDGDLVRAWRAADDAPRTHPGT